MYARWISHVDKVLFLYLECLAGDLRFGGRDLHVAKIWRET